MDDVENNFLVFDTETTGLSVAKGAEICQLSYILYNTKQNKVLFATSLGDDIIKVLGNIPKVTSDVHGITKEMTLDKKEIQHHIDQFIHYCSKATTIVGHNIGFDLRMVIGEIQRLLDKDDSLSSKKKETYNSFINRLGEKDTNICTMAKSAAKCKKIIDDVSPTKLGDLTQYIVPKKRKKGSAERSTLAKDFNKRGFKLMEVHALLFGQEVKGQLHNALVDIAVTLRVYVKILKDIDICSKDGKLISLSSPGKEVHNNKDICNLIKPVQIKESFKFANIKSKAEEPIIGAISVEQNGDITATSISCKKTGSSKTIITDQQSTNGMQETSSIDIPSRVISIKSKSIKSKKKKEKNCMDGVCTIMGGNKTRKKH